MYSMYVHMSSFVCTHVCVMVSVPSGCVDAQRHVFISRLLRLRHSSECLIPSGYCTFIQHKQRTLMYNIATHKPWYI